MTENRCPCCDGGRGSTVVIRRHTENQRHSIDCEALRTPDSAPRHDHAAQALTGGHGGSQLQEAVIVDMDGTLCDDYGRPIAQGLDFAKRHHAAGRILLIVTAREERWRHATSSWLRQNLPVPFEGPWHCRNGDTRSHAVVKHEIWQRLSKQYTNTAAIDDLPENLALWTRVGIPEVEAVPALGNRHG
jgi:hypothetical protein